MVGSVPLKPDHIAVPAILEPSPISSVYCQCPFWLSTDLPEHMGRVYKIFGGERANFEVEKLQDDILGCSKGR